MQVIEIILIGALIAGVAFLVIRTKDDKKVSQPAPKKPTEDVREAVKVDGISEKKVAENPKPKKKKTIKKKSVKQSRSVKAELKRY